MKRIALTAAILAGLLTSAAAADFTIPTTGGLPYKATPAPYFSWTGLYVGGNIGYGWAAHSFDIAPMDPKSQAFFALLGNPGSLDQTTRGAVGGGQVGLNYQFGQWVLGTEFMFDWSNMRSAAAQTASVGPVPVAMLSSGVRVDWDGALNARLGFVPMPNLMIAAIGGFAFGNISENAAVTCLVACGPFGFSNGAVNTHVGWDAGVELKYALTQNLIAGVTYRYVDLGNTSLFVSNAGLPPASFNAASSARWNEVLFRADWKF